ncbi:hypothetical protein CFL01nite_12210 [Corynebacterium flavescens]|uniref:HNH endonuclease n=1 Tax=Corynebacterium flavescens TaxID=28028 RepID=A0AB73B7N7_CORFL|nr:hypothetical protein CFL01nite_12210 [Corynebacterium flavescens]
MPEEVYATVMQRSQGRCEAGLDCCTGSPEEWHHRQRRQRNNDLVVNGAALCHACHHYITHVDPSVGRERGLIVHSHHPDPGQVPMMIRDEWFYLLADGGLEPAGEVQL